jgi:hypothetical protein
MRVRVLVAFVLSAFVARVVLPALHSHGDEAPSRCCCSHESSGTQGPAAEAADDRCTVCELLAVKVPALRAEAAPLVRSAAPSRAPRAPLYSPSPRSSHFRLAGAPRGPPPLPAL